MAEINHQIKTFIVDNFLFGDESGLNEDTSFIEKGIIDSTGILELIEFIDGKFQIVVTDEELLPENLDSVNKISKFIESKMTQGIIS